MKPKLLVLIFFVVSLLGATPRELTSREIFVDGTISRIEAIVELAPVPEHPGAAVFPSIKRDDWYPLNEFEPVTILPAGGQVGLRFNQVQGHAEPFFSQGDMLPQTIGALARVPAWLRPGTQNILLQLNAERQLLFAELLNTAPALWVDEIAFCLSMASPEYLNSPYALPQLLTENAQLIYARAAELPYVELVEVLDSQNGDYTTARYWKKDSTGQLLQLTVPRDIYYWYLVSPKITDEIAAYIDPSIVENNSSHANNIVAPPTGKFWREYFWDFEQDGYPVLSDTLTQCQTVFNRDGTPGDAIRAMTWWINQNMSFTSNSERPHQPVRIFAKRFGRCGEYADFSAAVARAALIPCNNVSSISTDHTWNEFWEDGWVSWEPVNGYLNNPLVYENGWGKVFGSVFQERCDGLFIPVTERYSEGLATINIQVIDVNQQPVDGARVVLAIFETTPRFDCVQYTDNQGMVSFPVGENRDYRARAETSFGLYPAIAGTYTQLINPSVSGEVYAYQFVIPAEMPVGAIEPLADPPDPLQDFRFSFQYSVPGYYVVGRALFDDIDVLGTLPRYYRYIPESSSASWMVADADNLLFLQVDNFASVYGYTGPAGTGEGNFGIPLGQDWYGFLDNSHRHGNSVLLQGSFALDYWGSAADEPQTYPASLSMSAPHPNPFLGGTTFNVNKDAPGILEVGIFNLRGQKLRSWEVEFVQAGLQEIAWDGREANGASPGSGIYLIRITDGRSAVLRKVVLTR